MQTPPPASRRTLPQLLGWNRTSYALMSAFVAIVLLIMYVWWPLVMDYFSQLDPNYPIWVQLDWLLIGIFLVMSLLIMAKADLRADALMVFVGLCGGLAIEGWGTQTHIWTYFTLERPPLWIIPAWPIASLSIDRLLRLLQQVTSHWPDQVFRLIYWPALGGFYVLMWVFVWPTLDKSLTILALLAVGLILISPTNYRLAVLTFAAGAGLGYFLELWGTTRYCWTYYTLQTPPLFAVLAHGVAAVAFWRVSRLLILIWGRIRLRSRAVQENPAA
ncbi:MAG TPA: hypothetical protein PKG95_03350 [Anaerolineaceae bacterium]|jgi:hypothetical protein|nr:hypothetical protein [Anaerolineaceae bacterium]